MTKIGEAKMAPITIRAIPIAIMQGVPKTIISIPNSHPVALWKLNFARKNKGIEKPTQRITPHPTKPYQIKIAGNMNIIPTTASINPNTMMNNGPTSIRTIELLTLWRNSSKYTPYRRHTNAKTTYISTANKYFMTTSF